MKKTCGNCGLPPLFGVCPYFKENFNPDTPGCPKWETDFEICAICGNPTIGGAVYFVDENNSNYLICSRCASASGKCSTCANSANCDFETNPSPLPKVIVQTSRQGNTIMQTQTMNPERIKITCHNCSCWNKEEEYCMRKELGHCLEGGWKIKLC